MINNFVQIRWFVRGRVVLLLVFEVLSFVRRCSQEVLHFALVMGGCSRGTVEPLFSQRGLPSNHVVRCMSNKRENAFLFSLL